MQKTAPALFTAITFLTPIALQALDYKSPFVGYVVAVGVLVAIVWWLAVALEYPKVMEWWPFDWPWWGSIPLTDAARIAFHRLDDTEWVRHALKRGSEEERLDQMAEYIAHEDNVPLSGRRPPGAHQELHWVANLAGIIRGGGKNLHMIGNDIPTYEDLRIERWRLWRVLRSMKAQALEELEALKEIETSYYGRVPPENLPP